MSNQCRNNSMNSRVKTFVGFIVLGLSLSLCIWQMTQADELNWEMLKNKNTSIEFFGSNQGDVISSYPALFHTLLNKFWGWNPAKELNYSTTNPNERVKVSEMTEFARNFAVEFDVSNSEHFRKVWFQLSPQLKVRGLFGIHDFKTKRPLIIIRLGIHGNVDELLAERFIAKAVYEDLDANFLILESLTSSAFLAKNPQVSFGGIEEGLHTFLIMNYLMDEKNDFKKYITQIHLIGVSLGGQGTFVTAWLDQLNGNRVKSILNFCPLINMQETFVKHNQKSFDSALIDVWNSFRMKAIYSSYPQAFSKVSWWKTLLDFKPRFTPRLLQVLKAERKTPLLALAEIEKQYPKVKWPEDFKKLITSSQSFYELNNFWKYYHGVNTPTTIYTTPKDPLVYNQLNSERIFSGQQPGHFVHLKYQRLEKGIHCGLASVYSWSFIVDLIKDGLDLK
jgi:hypothetical protein